MVRLPVFTRLEIKDYGLFPGKPRGSGIDWMFPRGLTLVAGVNGLGKTTLLTMMLRTLTGPYDLSGDGAPNTLDSILPADPIALKPHTARFFLQRVADGADLAEVRLQLSFGPHRLSIKRRLNNLDLIELVLDDKEYDIPRTRDKKELLFQGVLSDLFGLSSFVDVLLLIHHVIFFTENRAGALWDENAQRQVLRALFLPGEDATAISRLERDVSTFDSRARNVNALASSVKARLELAQQSEATSPQKKSELQAVQRMMSAQLERRRAIEAQLAQLDFDRHESRLMRERAKVARDEAERTVERVKYTALSRLFPKIDDASRLVLTRLLNEGYCLVCGATANDRRGELEQLVKNGYCPICHSEPSAQQNVVLPSAVEEARVHRARARADLAKTEEVTMASRLAAFEEQYDVALQTLEELRAELLEHRGKEQKLLSQLPDPSITVAQLTQTFETLKVEQEKYESERAVAAKALTNLQRKTESVLLAQTDSLSRSFGKLVNELLSEKAMLVRVEGKAKLIQGRGVSFTVPAFVPEMTASSRAGFVRRVSASDVSESQRELLDLAFRLALMQVATNDSACSLVMETPEASLDEMSMIQVGNSLRKFAGIGNNRLIVTSNLTNSGMVTALFGGKARSLAIAQKRGGHVLNLIDVAAPNAAVRSNGPAYRKLLKTAVTGMRAK